MNSSFQVGGHFLDPATCRRWREQPQVFVREFFGAEPDAWQDEVLEEFPKNPRIALLACKGPGKTTVLAWLGWNFVVTRLNPKVACVSITRDNLRDGLWTEFAKWQDRSEFLKERFTWTGNRIFLKEAPNTWWISARAFSKSATAAEQSATLAGLHEDYILFLLDETGDYPESVLPTAEAALSSCVEGHVVQAGNPSKLSGPLYHAASNRAQWKVIEITGDPDDPKRSPRVKEEWAREQIQRYGRDNPWVLVNVFGRFPPHSLDALIGPEEIAEAMNRSYNEDSISHAAKILGVDVARFGDDMSVIFPRQGLVAFTPRAYRNLDTTQGAAIVGNRWTEFDADATFIDETGGYGAGWIDALRQLGHSPIGVQFSSKPNDNRYRNKRAEIYFEMVEWIREGGQLPPIPELKTLAEITYTFDGDRLLLEDKDQIKSRSGTSPDHLDALALTFAQPVMAKNNRRSRGSRMKYETNPLIEFDREYAGMGR